MKWKSQLSGTQMIPSTILDTDDSKSIIRKTCLEKLCNGDKIHPCTGIRLSSVSGNKTEPKGQAKLKHKPRKTQTKSNVYSMQKSHTKPHFRFRLSPYI